MNESKVACVKTWTYFPDWQGSVYMSIMVFLWGKEAIEAYSWSKPFDSEFWTQKLSYFHMFYLHMIYEFLINSQELKNYLILLIVLNLYIICSTILHHP